MYMWRYPVGMRIPGRYRFGDEQTAGKLSCNNETIDSIVGVFRWNAVRDETDRDVEHGTYESTWALPTTKRSSKLTMFIRRPTAAIMTDSSSSRQTIQSDRLHLTHVTIDWLELKQLPTIANKFNKKCSDGMRATSSI